MPSDKQEDLTMLNPRDLRKNRQKRGKNPLSENLLTQEDPDDVRNMSSKQVKANLVDDRMKPNWVMRAKQAILDTPDLMKYERDVLIKDLDKYYSQYKNQLPSDAVHNILRNKGIKASGNPFLKTSQMEMTMINPFVKPSKTVLPVVQAKSNPFLKKATAEDGGYEGYLAEKCDTCKKEKCTCPICKGCGWKESECKCEKKSASANPFLKKAEMSDCSCDDELGHKEPCKVCKKEKCVCKKANANPFIKEAREFAFTDQQKKRKSGEDLLNKDKTKSDASVPSNKAADSDKVSPISPAFTDGTWKSYNWHTTFSPLDRLDARHAPNPVDFVPGYKEWYDREVDKYYDGWLNDHIENAGGSIPGSNTEKTMNLNEGERNHPPVYPTEAPTEKMLETRHQFNDYETVIASNGKEYKFSLNDIRTILIKTSANPNSLSAQENADKILEQVSVGNEHARNLLKAGLVTLERNKPGTLQGFIDAFAAQEKPVAPPTTDSLEDVMVNRLEREKDGDKIASTKKKIIV
jgi:hypothetical protein